MQRIQFQVKGRVQGVGFRYYVLQCAGQCNVSGWVRNEMDGSVAGEAQGMDKELDNFLNMLRQGNGLSRVENVWFSEISLQTDEKHFIISR